MKLPFIHEDFLLANRSAVALYRGFAEDQPILDYHCHLSPKEIAENRRWENLTQLWLQGDHYKWRAMRANGVPEQLITGSAPDREKFLAWAATVPKTLCNPLYHWTHLELKRTFDIETLLDENSAAHIWDTCNERLASPEFSCRSLIEKARVKVLCTTDDPIDGLEHHAVLASDPSFPVKVLPAFRPDRAMAMEVPAIFRDYAESLGAAAQVDIATFGGFLEALYHRHKFFHERGCRLSDHGLNRPHAEDCTESQAAGIYAKVLGGTQPSPLEVSQFKSAMLLAFGVMDHTKGWVQQYHIGALRSVNVRMHRQLGPDTGFDAIGDRPVARGLAKLLARLDEEDHLPRTIIYNLNPADNEVMAALAGCFQDGITPGKIQFGSAWWFLDQKDGIERQLRCLASLGLLSRFIGMLTDSRSFLSYSRHEYFRRVLCNLLGEEMEKGLLPDDLDLVGGMVRDICYGNAEAYFGFAGGGGK